MNGSYCYSNVNPNQAIPLPAPGMPFPHPGGAGVPFRPHSQPTSTQSPTPRMNYAQAEFLNIGHQSIIYIPPAHLSEVNHGPVHNIVQEGMLPPLPSEIHPDYRVNANTYGPRHDAVWAPNPGEMFTFGDMLSALPPLTPSPMAAEAPSGFPPAGRPVMSRSTRRDRFSPMESVGARAMGGPVSAPGAPENPTVSANGRATAALPSRLAVGAGQSRRATRKRRERLASSRDL